MTTRKLPELVRSETIAQWESNDYAMECVNVIVVGCGAAGANAAIETAHAGADVLVIERTIRLSRADITNSGLPNAPDLKFEIF